MPKLKIMKQELVKQMLEIAANIKHGEKARAIRDIPVSEPTLNKYLSGDVVKFELADRIIRYFKNLNE